MEEPKVGLAIEVLRVVAWFAIVMFVLWLLLLGVGHLFDDANL